jgi:hypothetical protein
MPTISVILNIVFSVGVVVVIAGGLFIAMATQHRDHNVLAAGSLLRRRLWSRTGRPHAGPVRPWVVRDGEVWPAS